MKFSEVFALCFFTRWLFRGGGEGGIAPEVCKPTLRERQSSSCMAWSVSVGASFTSCMCGYVSFIFQEGQLLVLLFLVFLTARTPRILLTLRTLKNPGKESENTPKDQGFPRQEKHQGHTNTKEKEGRGSTQWMFQYLFYCRRRTRIHIPKRLCRNSFSGLVHIFLLICP